MSRIYKRQTLARQELDKVWEHPSQVNVIHYSCESFYDRTDGTSPRITSIAIRNLENGQTQSFSIHQFGELNGHPIGELNNHYDDLEKKMLDAFFEFAKERKEYKWVHWNMRDGNYGFHAIELRHKILGGEPFVIQDDKKFDLARIIYSIYGKGYAPHGESGRLQSLIDMNDMRSRHAKTGAEEAALFEQSDYVALHQSTLAKADTLADLCQLAYENGLKTNAGFWNLHGHSIRAFMSWCSGHPYVTFFIMLTSLIANIVFLFSLTG